MQSACSFSGCAELPGNDSQIALGGWNFLCNGGTRNGMGCCSNADCSGGGTCQGGGDLDGDGTSDTDVGTVQQQAGTGLHELGHNLNLGHGGNNWLNNKPNYLSIMNYSFQLGGVPPTDPDGAGGPLVGRVDYSPAQLATLIENNLSEPAGIGDGTDSTVFWCPTDGNTPSGTGPGTGAIDWNCDGDGGTDTGVSSDINSDSGVDCVREGANGMLDTATAGDDVVAGTRIREGANLQCDTTATGDDVQWRPTGPLNGFDDWANIKYDFQTTDDYEDGVHTASVAMIEVDYETYSEELAPDPAVSITATPDPVLTGSEITYRIELSNNSAAAALNVVVSDALPAETTFVSCTATGGGVCGTAGTNRTVTYASLPGGETRMITIRATVNCPLVDGTSVDNNEASVTVSASNPPPVITDVAADPDELWPPNHHMVDVGVDYTVTDNCGPVTCELAVTSDEPQEGLGDGDTAPDWEVVDANNVRLRSERAGGGDGRSYSIAVTCTDSGGGSSTETTTVEVPHDRSGRALAGIGFDASGAALAPQASQFGLILPWTRAFDPSRVDAAGALVGHTLGTLAISNWLLTDVNGDRRTDLVLVYDAEAARALMAEGGGQSLALRYRMEDGTSYLVPDIFALSVTRGTPKR
jgi:uncharacterized repeat protein (TIGR01451 family)